MLLLNKISLMPASVSLLNAKKRVCLSNNAYYFAIV